MQFCNAILLRLNTLTEHLIFWYHRMGVRVHWEYGDIWIRLIEFATSFDFADTLDLFKTFDTLPF